MNPSEHYKNRSLLNLRLRRPASRYVQAYAVQLGAEGREPGMSELLRICVNDPVLAVWIMKNANSSYYGMRSTIDSLKRAFLVLGGPAVIRMISGTSASDEWASEDEILGDTSEVDSLLNRHSLATAMVAARLAGESVMSAESAFTAGLLHDIGKHLIFHNFEGEANGVYGESSLWDQIKGTDLHSVEQLAFGVNHSEVGEFLGRKMHFPDSLTIILAHNSYPDPSIHSPQQHPLLWITHAASLFSSSTGYAAGKRVSKKCCLENPVWQTLVDDRIVEYRQVSTMMDELHSLNDAISSACASSTITPDTDTAVTAAPVMNRDQAPNRNSRTTVRPTALSSDSEH